MTTDEIIRKQDDQLDRISLGLDNIHRIGGQIRAHVDDEKELLVKVDNQFDAMDWKLDQTSRRMTNFPRSESTKTTRYIVLIIVLMAILGVLAYLALS